MVLAGPPVAALNIWLGGLVERQGREELDLAARRHMVLSEARIARAVAALDELAARGIDSCRVTHVDALRQTTFAATPVKELSIVAPDGRTLCTDVGNQPDQRKVVSSEPLSAGSRNLLELVRLGGQPEQWLRIRRPGTGTGNGIAALIPAALFVPQVSTAGGPLQISGPDADRRRRGDRRGRAMRPPAPNGDDVHRRRSGLQPAMACKSVISASPAELAANQGDLRALGTIASGLLAIVILVLSLLLPKRERDNPIDEIERALKAGEFVPYFQPIVDIRSGRLRGAEVLIRWRKPDGTIVPPASFIPLARVERPHHRDDARADAARLPGGRRRARRAAASQDRLQPDGAPFRQRGDRRGRPQDFQEVAAAS